MRICHLSPARPDRNALIFPCSSRGCAQRIRERCRRTKVKGSADWESIELERPGGGTVTVTDVPAIQGPGPREEVEPFAGQVVDFVPTGESLLTAYVSGDNPSLDVVREIAERFGLVLQSQLWGLV
ncbi:Zn-dependent hydrolase [Streptomyces hygroscopicus subsp. limoneus]|nr:Zn-dependent hydrolase [Streptomyces hygroscopicus subsp. limoneus]